MRSTRKQQRKALKALALGFATAAIFTTTASAQFRSPGIPEGDNYVANLVQSAGVGAAAQQVEIPYLSWGATADDLGPFAQSTAGIPEGDNYVANLVRSAGVGVAAQHVETPYLSLPAGSSKTALANQSTRDGGPVFMNGVPDGYVGSGVEQNNSSGDGVTPTNLARAYHATEQGVAQPDGYQPQLQGDEQLVIRGKPDGFQPQTKTVESATVSASSDGVDRGDLALGFGLGLILATACAIALAMTRDRQRSHMAHS